MSTYTVDGAPILSTNGGDPVNYLDAAVLYTWRVNPVPYCPFNINGPDGLQIWQTEITDRGDTYVSRKLRAV